MLVARVFLVTSVITAFGCGGSNTPSSNPSSPTTPSNSSPVLTAFSPTSVRPDTDVTIEGRNLLTSAQKAPVVYFDRFMAAVKSPSNTQLVVTVPAAITSTVKVSVNVDGRASNELSFTLQPADLLDGSYSGPVTAPGQPVGTLTMVITHSGGTIQGKSNFKYSNTNPPAGSFGCPDYGSLSMGVVVNEPTSYGRFAGTDVHGSTLSGRWTTPTRLEGTFTLIGPFACSGGGAISRSFTVTRQ